MKEVFFEEEFLDSLTGYAVTLPLVVSPIFFPAVATSHSQELVHQVFV